MSEARITFLDYVAFSGANANGRRFERTLVRFGVEPPQGPKVEITEFFACVTRWKDNDYNYASGGYIFEEVVLALIVNALTSGLKADVNDPANPLTQQVLLKRDYLARKTQ